MNNIELLLYILAVLAAAMPLVRRRDCRPRLKWVAAVLCSLVCIAAAVFWSPSDPAAWRPEFLLPVQTAGDGFVSSRTCRSCHPGHYHSWRESYHRTMTQIASPEAIKAPFDGTVLESRGRTYRVYRVGDEFRVDMPDPDWESELVRRGVDLNQVLQAPVRPSRIVMATGSHHYQVYWVASRRGRELRQFPWAYHLKEQRWIPGEDVFIRPPDAPRRFALWNNNCIQCHSVRGVPGIDPQSKDLFSTVAEFGISCEACHGPGEQHVRKQRDPLTRYRQRLSDKPDPTIVNPRRLTAEASSQVCGQCHSNFSPVDVDQWFRDGYAYRAGGKLEQSHRPLQFDDMHTREFHAAAFWPDGTSRIGGREYTAMVESACFAGGELSCLSCHSMHDSDPNDQLARQLSGNEACLQCHQSFRDRIEQHSHHAADSPGGRCYDCHMPHTTYALFKGIRSHRIDSPSAANSVATGRPNACNLCHTDKTLAWTADHLQEWYAIEPPALSDQQQRISAALLWLLKGDAVQRAVAAWNIGSDDARHAAGDRWQGPFLAHLLNDSYAAVRFVGYDALRKFPGFEGFDYDFVGPAADRDAAKRQAVRLWNPSDNPRRDASILVDETGEFFHDAVHAIIDQRDNTPIELPE